MPMLLEVFSEEDSYEDEEANDNHITTVLESFHLNIASECSASQIGLWVRIAVDRTQQSDVLLDVPSSQFTFRSLVKLRLLSVIYSDDESFSSLISTCPVLEELAVETRPQTMLGIPVVHWTSMLVSLLHHSPKLQALKLVQDHGMPAERKRFEWRDYEGTKVEKEVAIYILNNAKRLVTATIYPFSVSLVRKCKMFEEVEIATRSLRAFKLVRKHQIFEEFEILQPEGQKHMGAYNEKLIVQES
ncbi:FBD-associated F-box protein At4g10400-like [Brassica rapa]|uniref:FBD-associated F-box protein At4g10400-like n=1 Tax=Brassica campestris TaxID=3711 RepID=UPI0004F141E5|nr:FBD-associated F-box protein At4g10400-like [Brassica rapa]